VEPIPPIKQELSAEVKGLLDKGDMVRKTGDLIIARQVYNRAFEMGAAEGAMGVARTYDPAVYTEMKVQGITPDAAKAAEWYEKAKAAGVTEASAALTTTPAAAQP
jgi:TPR repeat protein